MKFFGPEYDSEKAIALAWCIAGIAILSASAAMDKSGVDGAVYFGACIKLAAAVCFVTGVHTITRNNRS